ncbi:hypothetical protein [Streptomyces kronopolitis]|uniref:hypothetical protein n=1 Tax=Streptomyces kronopolitis TaxID=1612435 RepID=UPI003D999AE5
MYQPAPGDRVRVTRRRPDGSVKFVKVGTVAAVGSLGFQFAEIGGGRRHIASSQSVAARMAGWTQTVEHFAA